MKIYPSFYLVLATLAHITVGDGGDWINPQRDPRVKNPKRNPFELTYNRRHSRKDKLDTAKRSFQNKRHISLLNDKNENSSQESEKKSFLSNQISHNSGLPKAWKRSMSLRRPARDPKIRDSKARASRIRNPKLRDLNAREPKNKVAKTRDPKGRELKDRDPKIREAKARDLRDPKVRELSARVGNRRFGDAQKKKTKRKQIPMRIFGIRQKKKSFVSRKADAVEIYRQLLIRSGQLQNFGTLGKKQQIELLRNLILSNRDKQPENNLRPWKTTTQATTKSSFGIEPSKKSLDTKRELLSNKFNSENNYRLTGNHGRLIPKPKPPLVFKNGGLQKNGPDRRYIAPEPLGWQESSMENKQNRNQKPASTLATASLSSPSRINMNGNAFMLTKNSDSIHYRMPARKTLFPVMKYKNRLSYKRRKGPSRKPDEAASRKEGEGVGGGAEDDSKEEKGDRDDKGKNEKGNDDVEQKEKANRDDKETSEKTFRRPKTWTKMNYRLPINMKIEPRTDNRRPLLRNRKYGFPRQFMYHNEPRPQVERRRKTHLPSTVIPLRVYRKEEKSRMFEGPRSTPKRSDLRENIPQSSNFVFAKQDNSKNGRVGRKAHRDSSEGLSDRSKNEKLHKYQSAATPALEPLNMASDFHYNYRPATYSMPRTLYGRPDYYDQLPFVDIADTNTRGQTSEENASSESDHQDRDQQDYNDDNDPPSYADMHGSDMTVGGDRTIDVHTFYDNNPMYMVPDTKPDEDDDGSEENGGDDGDPGHANGRPDSGSEEQDSPKHFQQTIHKNHDSPDTLLIVLDNQAKAKKKKANRQKNGNYERNPPKTKKAGPLIKADHSYSNGILVLMGNKKETKQTKPNIHAALELSSNGKQKAFNKKELYNYTTHEKISEKPTSRSSMREIGRSRIEGPPKKNTDNYRKPYKGSQGRKSALDDLLIELGTKENIFNIRTSNNGRKPSYHARISASKSLQEDRRHNVQAGNGSNSTDMERVKKIVANEYRNINSTDDDNGHIETLSSSQIKPLNAEKIAKRTKTEIGLKTNHRHSDNSVKDSTNNKNRVSGSSLLKANMTGERVWHIQDSPSGANKNQLKKSLREKNADAVVQNSEKRTPFSRTQVRTGYKDYFKGNNNNPKYPSRKPQRVSVAYQRGGVDYVYGPLNGYPNESPSHGNGEDAEGESAEEAPSNGVSLYPDIDNPPSGKLTPIYPSQLQDIYDYGHVHMNKGAQGEEEGDEDNDDVSEARVVDSESLLLPNHPSKLEYIDRTLDYHPHLTRERGTKQKSVIKGLHSTPVSDSLVRASNDAAVPETPKKSYTMENLNPYYSDFNSFKSFINLPPTNAEDYYAKMTDYALDAGGGDDDDDTEEDEDDDDDDGGGGGYTFMEAVYPTDGMGTQYPMGNFHADYHTPYYEISHDHEDGHSSQEAVDAEGEERNHFNDFMGIRSRYEDKPIDLPGLAKNGNETGLHSSSLEEPRNPGHISIRTLYKKHSHNREETQESLEDGPSDSNSMGDEAAYVGKTYKFPPKPNTHKAGISDQDDHFTSMNNHIGVYKKMKGSLPSGFYGVDSKHSLKKGNIEKMSDEEVPRSLEDAISDQEVYATPLGRTRGVQFRSKNNSLKSLRGRFRKYPIHFSRIYRIMNKGKKTTQRRDQLYKRLKEVHEKKGHGQSPQFGGVKNGSKTKDLLKEDDEEEKNKLGNVTIFYYKDHLPGSRNGYVMRSGARVVDSEESHSDRSSREYGRSVEDGSDDFRDDTVLASRGIYYRDRQGGEKGGSLESKHYQVVKQKNESSEELNRTTELKNEDPVKKKTIRVDPGSPGSRNETSEMEDNSGKKNASWKKDEFKDGDDIALGNEDKNGPFGQYDSDSISLAYQGPDGGQTGEFQGFIGKDLDKTEGVEDMQGTPESKLPTLEGDSIYHDVYGTPESDLQTGVNYENSYDYPSNVFSDYDYIGGTAVSQLSQDVDVSHGGSGALPDGVDAPGQEAIYSENNYPHSQQHNFMKDLRDEHFKYEDEHVDMANGIGNHGHSDVVRQRVSYGVKIEPDSKRYQDGRRQDIETLAMDKKLSHDKFQERMIKKEEDNQSSDGGIFGRETDKHYKTTVNNRESRYFASGNGILLEEPNFKPNSVSDFNDVTTPGYFQMSPSLKHEKLPTTSPSVEINRSEDLDIGRSRYQYIVDPEENLKKRQKGSPNGINFDLKKGHPLMPGTENDTNVGLIPEILPALDDINQGLGPVENGKAYFQASRTKINRTIKLDSQLDTKVVQENLGRGWHTLKKQTPKTVRINDSGVDTIDETRSKSLQIDKDLLNEVNGQRNNKRPVPDFVPKNDTEIGGLKNGNTIKNKTDVVSHGDRRQISLDESEKNVDLIDANISQVERTTDKRTKGVIQSTNKTNVFVPRYRTRITNWGRSGHSISRKIPERNVHKTSQIENQQNKRLPVVLPSSKIKEPDTFRAQEFFPPEPGTNHLPPSKANEQDTFRAQEFFPPEPGSNFLPPSKDNEQNSVKAQEFFPPEPGTNFLPPPKANERDNFRAQDFFPPEPGTNFLPPPKANEPDIFRAQEFFPPEPGTNFLPPPKAKEPDSVRNQEFFLQEPGVNFENIPVEEKRHHDLRGGDASPHIIPGIIPNTEHDFLQKEITVPMTNPSLVRGHKQPLNQPAKIIGSVTNLSIDPGNERPSFVDRSPSHETHGDSFRDLKLQSAPEMAISYSDTPDSRHTGPSLTSLDNLGSQAEETMQPGYSDQLNLSGLESTIHKKGSGILDTLTDPEILEFPHIGKEHWPNFQTSSITSGKTSALADSFSGGPKKPETPPLFNLVEESLLGAHESEMPFQNTDLVNHSSSGSQLMNAVDKTQPDPLYEHTHPENKGLTEGFLDPSRQVDLIDPSNNQKWFRSPEGAQSHSDSSNWFTDPTNPGDSNLDLLRVTENIKTGLRNIGELSTNNISEITKSLNPIKSEMRHGLDQLTSGQSLAKLPGIDILTDAFTDQVNLNDQKGFTKISDRQSPDVLETNQFPGKGLSPSLSENPDLTNGYSLPDRTRGKEVYGISDNPSNNPFQSFPGDYATIPEPDGRTGDIKIESHPPMILSVTDLQTGIKTHPNEDYQDSSHPHKEKLSELQSMVGITEPTTLTNRDTFQGVIESIEPLNTDKITGITRVNPANIDNLSETSYGSSTADRGSLTVGAQGNGPEISDKSHRTVLDAIDSLSKTMSKNRQTDLDTRQPESYLGNTYPATGIMDNLDPLRLGTLIDLPLGTNPKDVNPMIEPSRSSDWTIDPTFITNQGPVGTGITKVSDQLSGSDLQTGKFHISDYIGPEMIDKKWTSGDLTPPHMITGISDSGDVPVTDTLNNLFQTGHQLELISHKNDSDLIRSPTTNAGHSAIRGDSLLPTDTAADLGLSPLISRSSDMVDTDGLPTNQEQLTTKADEHLFHSRSRGSLRSLPPVSHSNGKIDINMLSTLTGIDNLTGIHEVSPSHVPSQTLSGLTKTGYSDPGVTLNRSQAGMQTPNAAKGTDEMSVQMGPYHTNPIIEDTLWDLNGTTLLDPMPGMPHSGYETKQDRGAHTVENQGSRTSPNTFYGRDASDFLTVPVDGSTDTKRIETFGDFLRSPTDTILNNDSTATQDMALTSSFPRLSLEGRQKLEPLNVDDLSKRIESSLPLTGTFHTGDPSRRDGIDYSLVDPALKEKLDRMSDLKHLDTNVFHSSDSVDLAQTPLVSDPSQTSTIHDRAQTITDRDSRLGDPASLSVEGVSHTDLTSKILPVETTEDGGTPDTKTESSQGADLLRTGGLLSSVDPSKLDSLDGASLSPDMFTLPRMSYTDPLLDLNSISGKERLAVHGQESQPSIDVPIQDPQTEKDTPSTLSESNGLIDKEGLFGLTSSQIETHKSPSVDKVDVHSLPDTSYIRSHSISPDTPSPSSRDRLSKGILSSDLSLISGLSSVDTVPELSVGDLPTTGLSHAEGLALSQMLHTVGLTDGLTVQEAAKTKSPSDQRSVTEGSFDTSQIEAKGTGKTDHLLTGVSSKQPIDIGFDNKFPSSWHNLLLNHSRGFNFDPAFEIENVHQPRKVNESSLGNYTSESTLTKSAPLGSSSLAFTDQEITLDGFLGGTGSSHGHQPDQKISKSWTISSLSSSGTSNQRSQDFRTLLDLPSTFLFGQLVNDSAGSSDLDAIKPSQPKDASLIGATTGSEGPGSTVEIRDNVSGSSDKEGLTSSYENRSSKIDLSKVDPTKVDPSKVDHQITKSDLTPLIPRIMKPSPTAADMSASFDLSRLFGFAGQTRQVKPERTTSKMTLSDKRPIFLSYQSLSSDPSLDLDPDLIPISEQSTTPRTVSKQDPLTENIKGVSMSRDPQEAFRTVPHKVSKQDTPTDEVLMSGASQGADRTTPHMTSKHSPLIDDVKGFSMSGAPQGAVRTTRNAESPLDHGFLDTLSRTDMDGQFSLDKGIAAAEYSNPSKLSDASYSQPHIIPTDHIGTGYGRSFEDTQRAYSKRDPTGYPSGRWITQDGSPGATFEVGSSNPDLALPVNESGSLFTEIPAATMDKSFQSSEFPKRIEDFDRAYLLKFHIPEDQSLSTEPKEPFTLPVTTTTDRPTRKMIPNWKQTTTGIRSSLVSFTSPQSTLIQPVVAKPCADCIKHVWEDAHGYMLGMDQPVDFRNITFRRDPDASYYLVDNTYEVIRSLNLQMVKRQVCKCVLSSEPIQKIQVQCKEQMNGRLIHVDLPYKRRNTDLNCHIDIYNGTWQGYKSCKDGEKYCDYMFGTRFGECTHLLGRNELLKYYSMCNTVLCRESGNMQQWKKDACDVLDALAHECELVGAKVAWREVTKCYKQCPLNMEFKTNVSVCRKTCNNLEADFSCHTDRTESRCDCKEGFVLNQETCIPKQKCGCTYEGHYINIGETLSLSDCKTLVTCGFDAKGWSEVQFISIPGCSARQSCQLVNGSYSCIVQCGNDVCHENATCEQGKCRCNAGLYGDGVTTCLSTNNTCTCVVSGLSRYRTFDGQMLNYLSTCPIELATTIDRSNPTKFTVYGTTLYNRAEMTGFGTKRYRTVNMTINGLNIYMDTMGDIYVDAVKTTLPFRNHKHNVSASASAGWTTVCASDGVYVSYDRKHRVKIFLPKAYRQKLAGMCGNCNGERKDDFYEKDKETPSSVDLVGASYTLNNSFSCGQLSSIKTCPEGMKRCEIMRTGPFTGCHPYLDPGVVEAYYNSCMQMTCAFKDHKDSLKKLTCAALESLDTECMSRGYPVEWRAQSSCSISCCQPMVYSKFMNESDSNCVPSTPVCPAQPVDGCVCADGYVLDNNKCVRSQDCGCWYNNSIYIQLGETYHIPGCRLMVQCLKVATGKKRLVVTRLEKGCGENSKCVLKDHKHQCVCEEGFARNKNDTFCQKIPECGDSPVDVVFVVDTSGSINITGLSSTKNFLAHFINSTNIGPQNMQVSILLFNDKPHNLFQLNKYPRKREMLTSLQRIGPPEGTTYLGRALVFVALVSLQEKMGARENVDRAVIILTDGVLHDPNRAERWSALLRRQKQAELFAIGVGEADPAQLQRLTRDKNNVFYVREYENLNSVMDNLLQGVCK